MKETEDTSPANETEGQTTKSASRTKLRENRHDSETFHNADVDVDAVDLSISSFWLHGSWFQNMRGERRSLNLSNMKLMPPPKFSKKHGNINTNLYKAFGSLSLLGRFNRDCDGVPRQNCTRLFSVLKPLLWQTDPCRHLSVRR